MLDTAPEITGEALKTWHDLGPLNIHEIRENTNCFDSFKEHCYDEQIINHLSFYGEKHIGTNEFWGVIRKVNTFANIIYEGQFFKGKA